ncbi:MAG TPA: TolC family protein [Blastocatellia bacterium]|nr:TolC family protein [Blastocatellia bacterium]
MLKHSISMLACASLLAGLGLNPGAFAQSPAAGRQTDPGATGRQPSRPKSPAPPQEAGQSAGQALGQPAGQTGVVAPVQLPKEPPPVASGYQSPGRALPSAERVGVNVADQVSLTLNEAIALALANNKDISASRIDVDIARFDVESSRGIYDPRLEGDVDYRKTTSPSASFIAGGAGGKTRQTDVTGSARVAGNSPYFGGNYQLDFSSGRSTTNNQFTALNPQYPSALTFTYAQPLLRGLRIDENRRRIEVAKRNVTLSDLQFRQRVIETINRVQQAYWDLVFSLRNLQVQLDAVKQARAQLESNRRQVEQGTLAPVDIASAEAQVANFEQDVYSAQENVTRSENNLKALMLPERTAPLWSRAILPVSPVTLEPPRVSLDQAVTSALTNRPELEQAETSAEINKINTRLFRDQTRPQIDLVGSYSAVGLAGSSVGGNNPLTAGNVALFSRVNELSERAGLPPVSVPATGGALPDFFLGGAGQSLSNLFNLNFPTARIGLTFSFPIGNRTARANLGRSLAEGRRIQNQREQLEQQIEVDVRNSLQTVKSAEARLAAAAAARIAAQQQNESEQRRFDSGLSTVFLVLQRQTELISARGRELQAQTDLNKAIAEFQRATGYTLQANNVTLLKDAQPRLNREGVAAGATPANPQ